jgi:hypothetical protein
LEDLNINKLIVNNSILVVFPSNIFSGHESMAVNILNRMPNKKIIFISSNLSKFIIKNSEVIYFDSKFSLLKLLFFQRFKNTSTKLLLISGSPFAYPFLKLLIKLLIFYLVEYVPMPELSNMKDRLHHFLMPFINKALINKRVLIDNWQINHSSVKDVLIIKNLV